MPTARVQVAAAAVSDVVYVAGGWPGSGPVGSLVEVYSVLTDAWATGPHVCTGTGLTPFHICTGTGLAPATFA